MVASSGRGATLGTLPISSSRGAGDNRTMPTASEYEQFEVDFGKLAVKVDEVRGAVARERSTPGVGGTFGSLVDLTIDSITDRSERAVPNLDDAATECARRAQVCEDYAKEVEQYESDLAEWNAKFDDFDPSDPWGTSPGPRPREPERPADWVEI